MARRTLSGRIYRRRYRGEESGPFWIDYYDGHGKQHRESSKSLKVGDARRLLEKRIAEVRSGHHGGRSAERVTVGDLLDTVLADYEANGKRLKFAANCINRLRPALGSMRASRVTTATINGYVNDRRQAGRAAATINRELAILRRAFTMASGETPPRVARVPKFPTLKENPPRQGFFSPEEYDALMAELAPHVQPVVAFGYQTGCRLSEILNLQWAQVSLEDRSINLLAGQTKNGEPRTIPLTDDLHERLTTLLASRDEYWPECPWVFSRAGQRLLSIRTAWNAACRRAASQCPTLWIADTKKPGRLFHDLRRSAIRNFVRSGVPETVCRRISGHLTASVFLRYDIVSGDDLRRAAASLDSYLNLSGSNSTDSSTKQARKANRSNP